MVKNPPAMHETRVPSLGRKAPLDKQMAAHSRIPTWEIPWTEEPVRLQSMEVTEESDITEQLNSNNKESNTTL